MPECRKCETEITVGSEIEVKCPKCGAEYLVAFHKEMVRQYWGSFPHAILIPKREKGEEA